VRVGEKINARLNFEAQGTGKPCKAGVGDGTKANRLKMVSRGIAEISLRESMTGQTVLSAAFLSNASRDFSSLER